MRCVDLRWIATNQPKCEFRTHENAPGFNDKHITLSVRLAEPDRRRHLRILLKERAPDLPADEVTEFCRGRGVPPLAQGFSAGLANRVSDFQPVFRPINSASKRGITPQSRAADLTEIRDQFVKLVLRHGSGPAGRLHRCLLPAGPNQVNLARLSRGNRQHRCRDCNSHRSSSRDRHERSRQPIFWFS